MTTYMTSFTWLLFVKQHLNLFKYVQRISFKYFKRCDRILAPFISPMLNENGQTFSFSIKMLYNGLSAI